MPRPNIEPWIGEITKILQEMPIDLYGGIDTYKEPSIRKTRNKIVKVIKKHLGELEGNIELLDDSQTSWSSKFRTDRAFTEETMFLMTLTDKLNEVIQKVNTTSHSE